MLKKQDIRITEKAFNLENNVLILPIEPLNYDLEGKTITAVFEPAKVETGALEVVDGLIQIPIYSSMVQPGVNSIQLNFRWDNTRLEQSPKMMWVIDKSLITESPAQEEVDIISYLLNEINAAKDTADRMISDSGDVKQALDSSVEDAREAKTALDGSVEAAGTKKTQLDDNITDANTINNTLTDPVTGTIKKATDSKVALEEKITDAGTAKSEIEQAIIDNQIVKQSEFDDLANQVALDKLDYTDLKGVNDGVITLEKTDFVKTSTNLYNKELVINKKSILQTTGIINDHAYYSIVSIKSIIESQIYSAIGFRRVGFYKEDGSCLGTSELTFTTHSTFTPPIGTTSIILVIDSTTINNAQLNKGSILLPYEEYYTTINYLQTDKRLNKLNTDYEKFRNQFNSLENIIKNPLSIDNWTPTGCVLSVVDGSVKMTGNGWTGNTFSMMKELDYQITNHKVFIRATVEITSDMANQVSIRANGKDSGLESIVKIINNPKQGIHELSGIFTPSNHVGKLIFRVHAGHNIISSNISMTIKNFVVIDLTDIFGEGKEPDAPIIESVLENAEYKWEIESSLKSSIQDSINKYGIELETVELPTTIDSFATSRLSLIATKKDNYYNVLNPPIQTPQDVGYLYLDEKTNKMYYSSGVYNKPEFLCDWDKDLAGGFDCKYFVPSITKDGDIIFLAQGKRGLRLNPIIYPSSNYSNPVIVDLGELLPPSGLTTDTGICHSFFDDFFIFGEYVSSGTVAINGEPMRLFKVTKPYTTPSNWRVVDTWYYSSTNSPWGQNPSREITHFHTVTYDHYTNVWYANTGDADSMCRVLSSTDDGETWNEVASNGQKWRTLGYIFTEDACYWGTDADSIEHALYKATRNESGLVDFSTITKLAQLNLSGQRVYNTCLVREPYGLLLLDRAEPRLDGLFDVEFYSLEHNKLYHLATLDSLYTDDGRYGFGNLATTYYQSVQEDGIICGGNSYDRDMSLKVLNNSPENRLGVTKIKVVRK